MSLDLLAKHPFITTIGTHNRIDFARAAFSDSIIDILHILDDSLYLCSLKIGSITSQEMNLKLDKTINCALEKCKLNKIMLTNNTLYSIFRVDLEQEAVKFLEAYYLLILRK